MSCKVNKQVLIKLATVRLAINYILRQRLTKQASKDRVPTDEEYPFFGISSPHSEEVYTKLRQGKLSLEEKDLLRRYMAYIEKQIPDTYPLKQQKRILNDELLGLGEVNNQMTDDQMGIEFGLMSDDAVDEEGNFLYPDEYTNLGREILKLHNKKYNDITGENQAYVDIFNPDWMR